MGRKRPEADQLQLLGRMRTLMEQHHQITQCVREGCKESKWHRPDMPECRFHIVKVCLRCDRVLNSCCEDPDMCGIHKDFLDMEQFKP